MSDLLNEDDRARLPSDVDPDVLVELLQRLPEEGHRQIIDLLIDPQRYLGTNAELFASRLGSDDPTLAAIIARLYRTD
jgi:hypothetical protein